MLLLAILLVASPAPAQQPRPQQMPANDDSTVLFRGLLHFHGIQPETTANMLRGGYDYSNLIVVISGDPKSQDVRNYCRTTLGRGGAVLIAADTELSVSGFFPEPADVKITGSRVSFSQPTAVDNGSPTRPLAIPLPTDGISPFSGTGRVATNQPSYVIAVRPPTGFNLKPVAVFPSGATVTTPQGRDVPGVGLLSLPFALATTDDRGTLRCMVMADPDVFSNRMIYTSGREESPTDNLKFANNTVQWLKGGGRTKCLFIENGNVMPKFDEFEFSSIPLGPPMPPPPIPNIDVFDPELQQKVTDALNQAADQAQKNDAVNQGILGLFGGRIWLVITVIATVLLFLIYAIVRRRTMAWYRRIFRPIPRDAAMLGPDTPVGSLGHRRLELLRSADYGPVVRPVVRQLFQDRGLPGEYTGDKLPPLDIDVRRPQFLKESIHTLWTAIRSPAAIAYGKWKQLEPLLAAVRAAADDDRWRFVAP